PTQDMVLGLYYLSLAQNEDRKDEEIPAFGSVSEALLALDRGHSLHDPIRIRIAGKAIPAEMLPEGYDPAAEEWKDRAPVVTTTRSAPRRSSSSIAGASSPTMSAARS